MCGLLVGSKPFSRAPRAGFFACARATPKCDSGADVSRAHGRYTAKPLSLKRTKPDTIERNAAMLEQVALDDSVKKQILELEMKLGSVDHFTLLGVLPDADPE